MARALVGWVLAGALSFAIPEGAECTGWVKAVARGIPSATLVAYTPMSGLMTCSSNDEVHDFADNPHFQRMIANPEPTVMYNPHGPVSMVAVEGAFGRVDRNLMMVDAQAVALRIAIGEETGL